MEEPAAAAANPHITFDQTPRTRFYMCSNLSCKTHVLSSENFVYKDRELDGIQCNNPVNVTAPDDRNYWTKYQTYDAVEVYCNGCNRSLGYKLLWFDEKMVQNPYVFFQDRLLYWNGNQVVYVATNKPVEDN